MLQVLVGLRDCPKNTLNRLGYLNLNSGFQAKILSMIYLLTLKRNHILCFSGKHQKYINGTSIFGVASQEQFVVAGVGWDRSKSRTFLSEIDGDGNRILFESFKGDPGLQLTPELYFNQNSHVVGIFSFNNFCLITDISPFRTSNVDSRSSYCRW